MRATSSPAEPARRPRAGRLAQGQWRRPRRRAGPPRAATTGPALRDCRGRCHGSCSAHPRDRRPARPQGRDPRGRDREGRHAGPARPRERAGGPGAQDRRRTPSRRADARSCARLLRPGVVDGRQPRLARSGGLCQRERLARRPGGGTARPRPHRNVDRLRTLDGRHVCGVERARARASGARRLPTDGATSRRGGLCPRSCRWMPSTGW